MQTNLLLPNTHTDGPDCRGDKDNRLDLDTAEGHGSGSVGITGPPTVRGTLSFNGMEVGELEGKAWSWRPVGNLLSGPPG